MKKVKLGEICEINIGKTPSRSEKSFWNGEFCWLSISDMKSKFLSQTKEKITDKAINNTNMKIVRKGTVVMSFKLSIGKVAILSEDMYTNEAIANFVIKNKYDILTDYLYYALQSLKFDHLGDRAVMGKTLNKVKLNNLSIVFYEPNEQRKIVDKLDVISNLIDYRQKQFKELSDLVKSRFYEMFGDPILNEKNWKKCHLKDIATEKLSYGSGASAVEFSGLRYIRITDIDDNGNLKSDAKSPSSFDEKYLLNDGDILFARSGATVGKTFCYSRQKHGRAIYAGYLIRLVPDFKQVNSTFVYHFTNTKYYDDFIFKAQKAVAQPNINAQQYGELDFILPPLILQNQFADFVAEVDKSQLAGQMVLKLWRKLLKFSIIKLSFYEK